MNLHMFGYILPERGELKIRELEVYQSYYCGLCQSLKKQYHFLGCLSLNYDMAFLGLLLTALYGMERSGRQYHCFVHAGKKKFAIENPYLDYAADMNILLACYKCQDNWNDERKFSSAAYAVLLSQAKKKICKKYPEKVASVQKYLNMLSEYEKAECSNLDEVAGCFGKICAEIFGYGVPWKNSLQKMGFYLGKFIYILDAYDDLEEDRKKHCYNPLVFYELREDFPSWVYQALNMMMAETCREFEKLPVTEDAEILRNILYAGVWGKFNQATERRKTGGIR